MIALCHFTRKHSWRCWNKSQTTETNWFCGLFWSHYCFWWFRIAPGCSLKKDRKWITKFASKFQRVMCCPDCKPHLDVTMSSLKTELPHTANFIQNSCKKYFWTFWQINLPSIQTLTLIIWTLWYGLYQCAMFHISYTLWGKLWKWSTSEMPANLCVVQIPIAQR